MLKLHAGPDGMVYLKGGGLTECRWRFIRYANVQIWTWNFG